MKRQSILFVRSMWVVILFTTLAACKDTDNRVFGDDFEFPALTDENTIRFTVNVPEQLPVLHDKTSRRETA